MTQDQNPKLREGLEACRIDYRGEKMFVIQDRMGFTQANLIFTPAAIHIVANMNGTNSLKDLQADFMSQTGQLIQMQELRDLVKNLDQHLFLDNARFRDQAARKISEFIDNPVRKMRHAGSSYPAQPEELKEKLRSFFSPQNGGPGFPCPSEERGRKIVGLVAPHIDLNAGGPCFAHAYKAAAEASVPDTWIVLGTGHEYVKNFFALTVKDFETPLGPVQCDRQICEQLLGQTVFNLRASEYNHLSEHTIEFQAVFLSFLQPGTRIVPLLCSFGQQEFVAGQNLIDEFAALLSRIVFESKGSVGIIASVDFAHIGPRYGDSFTPDKAMIEQSLSLDGSLLKVLERCAAADFIQAINRDSNSRKICGVAPLYTMAKALEGRVHGTTLSQSHAIVDQQGSFVTFAGMAFYEGTDRN
jgi:AmmeMemoRadiSam system protein B